MVTNNENDNDNENNNSREKSKDKFNIINIFYGVSPFVKDYTKNNELEVKFGTRGFKQFSKIDYDNVIRQLKSLGFSSLNEQGEYLFRIQNEFLDPKSGQFRMSSIRTEIVGFHPIQEYCKSNNINTVKNAQDYTQSVNFVKKTPYIHKNEILRDENFDDFKFRISFKTEEKINITNPIIRSLTESWDKVKKTFRYINRVSFIHPDLPVSVDISIIKSSKREGREYKKTYTTDESGIFTNPESYEIEIEVDNSKIGPSTSFSSGASLIQAVRKSIKYVLMGLQGTNYPISYIEQSDCLKNYLKIIQQDAFKIDKRIYPSDFIGPNSYTLQMQNIVPIDENINIPNIRKDYVVTDKADGERHLMFISAVGKIYLINTNMDVIFTGAKTNEKTTYNSLLDGELILHDKSGLFINLYAVFDIYYVNKEDVRHLPFLKLIEDEDKEKKEKEKEKKEKEKTKKEKDRDDDDDEKYGKKDDGEKGMKKLKTARYVLLKKMMEVLLPVSIIEGDICPLRIESKRFYPDSIALVVSEEEIKKISKSESKSVPKTSSNTTIFRACKTILTKIENGLFEYNTDGLIFTPAFLGVGSNEIGKAGKITKTTWDYSFKWKPAEFNTIDFLVTTKKQTNGDDQITHVFEDGISVTRVNGDLTQYKTLVLRCGFDKRKHGYLNPCQDVIDDHLPEFGNLENEETYEPVRFVPTQPYDPKAGISNIMLKKDDTGIDQMFTEEGEVFQDNTIVEFKYDLNIEESEWRWTPLRVRYDKTAELRQGLKNYGNAYHVANSNWKSIHHPITAEMIGTGMNIPENIEDTDVYYNRMLSSTKTRALRDFHNLFVKRLLIKSVSKRGDILIDYACGKGGDFSKWINAQLSFIFGIDISKDNLENKLDGACARFLANRAKFKHVPYALFVNGNSSLNIRSGQAMLNDKAIQITKAVFGEGPKNAESLGKGVLRQYGKGVEGFNISSCQFALHYFFENTSTFQNFLINLSECTKLGGYFIGASYDGKTVFNMLKNKGKGDGVILVDEEVKVWELKKQYDEMDFPDDITSLGYKIEVYQESINKLIPEYLVNYDYLNRVMEDYGFTLINREEAKQLGLPEGTGLFGELYQSMMEGLKMNKYASKDYGEADHMTAYEKKISFLNRYFVYKKVRNVNAVKVIIEGEEEESKEEKMEKKKTLVPKIKKTLEESVKTKTAKSVVKPKVKKLSAKLVLVEDSSTTIVEPEKTTEVEKVTQVEKAKEVEKPKEKKATKSKKPKLIIEEENIIAPPIIIEGTKPKEKKATKSKKLNIIMEE